MTSSPLIVMTGPTASGKGAVAFELAKRLAGEIVSLDSMKVYREMDIGTAKPTPERRAQVRYHLIDIVSPDGHFSTGDYLPRLDAAIADVAARDRVPILCGGTALYLKGFLDGFTPLPAANWTIRERLLDEAREVGSEALHARLALVDPRAAEKFLPGDLRRIVRALEVYEATGRPVSDGWDWTATERRSVRLYGLAWERSVLYARTDRRVLDMIERGLFEEAECLRKRSPPISRSASQCIGYKEIFEGWEKGWERDEIIMRIQRKTRRYVKSQLTWFRKLPITWFPCDANFSAARIAEEIAKRYRTPQE